MSFVPARSVISLMISPSLLLGVAERFLVRECLHYEIEQTTTPYTLQDSENVYNLTGKVVDSASFLVPQEFYGYKDSNNTFGVPELKGAMPMCFQVVSHNQLRAFGGKGSEQLMRNFLTQPAVIRRDEEKLPDVDVAGSAGRRDVEVDERAARAPDLAIAVDVPAAPPTNATELMSHEKLRRKKLPSIMLNRKWKMPDFISTKDHSTTATTMSKTVSPRPPKETYLLDDFVPWGYKKLRKVIDFFSAVPALADYIARAPIVMVVGRESAIPPGNMANDRWVLQTQGRSRWRLEPVQHREADGQTWLLSHEIIRRKQQKMLGDLHPAGPTETSDGRINCEKDRFPIHLETGDALYAPAGFIWEACLSEEFVGATGERGLIRLRKMPKPFQAISSQRPAPRSVVRSRGITCQFAVCSTNMGGSTIDRVQAVWFYYSSQQRGACGE